MVDISTYRARIGRFSWSRHLIGMDAVITVGVVGFIGLLLFMAGVELNPGPRPIDKDELSTVLLPESYQNNYYAGVCTGNGNCLYNTCSIIIQGDETLADILRHSVAEELQTHPIHYCMEHPYIQSLVHDKQMTSDDILVMYQTMLCGEDDSLTLTKENLQHTIQSLPQRCSE